jgi:glycine/D-amino acid oxidase-like deaminating enzyme
MSIVLFGFTFTYMSIEKNLAGFWPVGRDDLSILGKVDGIEGFIMAASRNDHGICLGPGKGKLTRELICKGRTSTSVESLNLSRFN